MSEETPTKVNPITAFLQSINRSKEDLMRDQMDPPEYVSFVINRMMSYSPDTVMLAHLMSQASHIPEQMQFDFYRIAVPVRNRYNPLHRVPKNEDVELLKAALGYSTRQARHALKALKPEQIESIRALMDPGGTKDTKRKK